jgi:hypothetical protein
LTLPFAGGVTISVGACAVNVARVGVVEFGELDFELDEHPDAATSAATTAHTNNALVERRRNMDAHAIHCHLALVVRPWQPLGEH